MLASIFACYVLFLTSTSLVTAFLPYHQHMFSVCEVIRVSAILCTFSILFSSLLSRHAAHEPPFRSISSTFSTHLFYTMPTAPTQAQSLLHTFLHAHFSLIITRILIPNSSSFPHMCLLSLLSEFYTLSTGA